MRIKPYLSPSLIAGCAELPEGERAQPIAVCTTLEPPPILCHRTQCVAGRVRPTGAPALHSDHKPMRARLRVWGR